MHGKADNEGRAGAARQIYGPGRAVWGMSWPDAQVSAASAQLFHEGPLGAHQAPAVAGLSGHMEQGDAAFLGQRLLRHTGLSCGVHWLSWPVTALPAAATFGSKGNATS